MKKLTNMKNNIYTTKLIDVVMAPTEKNGDGHIFLIMDFCNCDINEALLGSNSAHNLDQDHIISIMFNLLFAVNFMHSAGVVHRDLKPSNILIETDCTIKICDFGISRTI
jgi:serine/threonine protein kinase